MRPQGSFPAGPGEPGVEARGNRPARRTGMRRPPATTPRPASPTRRAPYLAPRRLVFVRGPAAPADATPPCPPPVWLGRRGGTGSLLAAAPLARAHTARRRSRRRLPPAQRGGRGNTTRPRRRRPRAAGARGWRAAPQRHPPLGDPRGTPAAGDGLGDRSHGSRARGTGPSPQGRAPGAIGTTPEEGGGCGAVGTRKRLGQGRPAGLGLRLSGAWRPTLGKGQGQGGSSPGGNALLGVHTPCGDAHREKWDPLSSGVQAADHPMDPRGLLLHPALRPTSVAARDIHPSKIGELLIPKFQTREEKKKLEKLVCYKSRSWVSSFCLPKMG